jgi:hypothetical protein
VSGVLRALVAVELQLCSDFSILFMLDALIAVVASLGGKKIAFFCFPFNPPTKFFRLNTKL